MELWLLTITSTNRDGVLLASKVTTVEKPGAANIPGSEIEKSQSSQVIFTVLKENKTALVVMGVILLNKEPFAASIAC